MVKLSKSVSPHLVVADRLIGALGVTGQYSDETIHASLGLMRLIVSPLPSAPVAAPIISALSSPQPPCDFARGIPLAGNGVNQHGITKENFTSASVAGLIGDLLSDSESQRSTKQKSVPRTDVHTENANTTEASTKATRP